MRGHTGQSERAAKNQAALLERIRQTRSLARRGFLTEAGMNHLRSMENIYRRTYGEDAR